MTLSRTSRGVGKLGPSLFPAQWKATRAIRRELISKILAGGGGSGGRGDGDGSGRGDRGGERSTFLPTTNNSEEHNSKHGEGNFRFSGSGNG